MTDVTLAIINHVNNDMNIIIISSLLILVDSITWTLS